LEIRDGRGFLFRGQVAKVVEERDSLFEEHPANDASQFGPIDKD
jgi:hypothetical protein